jgi:hypothetical protein
MTYKIRRALGVSLVLYVATLMLGTIYVALLGPDMSSMSNIPSSFWYVGMVKAVILTALSSLWYFKNNAIAASAKSGAFFGLTAVAVSFVLDFVLFSLGSSGEDAGLGAYFGDFRYWIILLLMVGTAVIVGRNKSKSST